MATDLFEPEIIVSSPPMIVANSVPFFSVEFVDANIDDFLTNDSTVLLSPVTSIYSANEFNVLLEPCTLAIVTLSLIVFLLPWVLTLFAV